MTKRLTSLRITDYTTAQIQQLRARIGANQTEIVALAIDRMYRQEFGNGINPMKQETQAMNDKITIILECLHALKRGVDRPTVVLEDDGSYSYIPAAHLGDISYTGSRSVLFDVAEASFGPEFDVDSATDMELREAAEWAAAEWDWTPETA